VEKEGGKGFKGRDILNLAAADRHTHMANELPSSPADVDVLVSGNNRCVLCCVV
jgi:hypothetical protein